MTNVAMFTTYAPSEGFGGPARAFHQRRVLEGAGHLVSHVVIQDKPSGGDTRSRDLIEITSRPAGQRIDHIYNDVDLAARAAMDGRLMERVINHLTEQRCDVIIMEQPFLIAVVEAVADRLRIPVVYSSQNIEYRLRKDLERFQFDAKRNPMRSAIVRQMEQRAVDLSSAVTAICPTDQEQMFEEFGCESTLVPNGSSASDVALPSRSSGAKPYFAFAGSAYWPNTEGFADMASPSLAFLPPTIKVQVAGTVGPELLQNRSIKRAESVNASRLEVRGFLSMEKLVAMMAHSRAVLVPVFTGEGSNLKSADALASGAPVIMTERATRGYERVIAADPEGITVVESAPEFRAAMADVLRQAPTLGPIGSDRRSALTWDRRVVPLIDVIEQAVVPQRQASH